MVMWGRGRAVGGRLGEWRPCLKRVASSLSTHSANARRRGDIETEGVPLPVRSALTSIGNAGRWVSTPPSIGNAGRWVSTPPSIGKAEVGEHTAIYRQGGQMGEHSAIYRQGV